MTSRRAAQISIARSRLDKLCITCRFESGGSNEMESDGICRTGDANESWDKGRTQLVKKPGTDLVLWK